jgi:hypothetical protein
VHFIKNNFKKGKTMKTIKFLLINLFILSTFSITNAVGPEPKEGDARWTKKTKDCVTTVKGSVVGFSFEISVTESDKQVHCIDGGEEKCEVIECKD